MVSVIVEKPYRFVPPHRGDWWPSMIQKFKLYERHLRDTDGVVDYELRNVDRLQESLRRGDGIMMAPNHSRYADPLVLGWLAKQARTHVFAMASWHLFNMGKFNAFSIQKMGAFSVFREGLDKQSIETAIDILVEARRPLVLFAEGATFRANDRLQPLLDGASLIARTAARRREKNSHGRVVVHPIAIKYVFQGDIYEWADKSLTAIEQRLTWEPNRHLPLRKRITHVADGLLALKEVQYLGSPQSGNVIQRQEYLTKALLQQVESKWKANAVDAADVGSVLNRVKAMRLQMFPELINDSTSPERKEAIRNDLRSLELAQQLASFPVGYLNEPPVTVTRVLETLENVEEAVFGKTSWPGPLKAIVDVGEAIEVPAERAPRKQEDPLMVEIAQQLQGMLNQLATEPRLLAADD
ncbi:1-acyl-sn-glycerol-3-phosphate acyltransferase [Rosistilla oblonga]|uniref:Acyltransferase n=1 Tax=Rosistilla oblonga TaxID=2527990 RepID=A0A518IP17_9BACT|nr:1-acyl-sn-glycerol-3-phosphate acyltransferase [Rosistilla oblonga]QDV54837.1 Acyltransferase [Rosistilla oblonga]